MSSIFLIPGVNLFWFAGYLKARGASLGHVPQSREKSAKILKYIFYTEKLVFLCALVALFF